MNLRGCVFLGCDLGEHLASQIQKCQADIVSRPSSLPDRLPAFAPGIYTVAELYDGLAEDGSGWETTPDYDGFKFFNEKKLTPRLLGPAESIAARLHDTVQEQAVRAFLARRHVVAFMGGHDFNRQLTPKESDAGKSDVYWECVSIAKKLTEEGFLILTGGGPGLMEAGNLGALLAFAQPDTIQRVRAVLKNYSFDSKEWRSSGMEARKLILGTWNGAPSPQQYSLGIPTWLYGHEPPNMFASHHSKMFYNSLREDGLVSLANSGIVFFEGNAGTVQEIFQDASQNYYVGEGQSPTPMIIYNSSGFWDRPCDKLSWPTDSPPDKRKPLLPLLKQLSIERNFMRSIFITQSPEATIQFLVNARPTTLPTRADVRLAGNRSSTSQS